MAKLRVGIVLIILSWLPIAQVMLSIAHNHQRLTSGHASDIFRLTVWGIQIVVGFVGLWLAGRIAVEAARDGGWKRVPANLWRLFWKGTP